MNFKLVLFIATTVASIICLGCGVRLYHSNPPKKKHRGQRRRPDLHVERAVNTEEVPSSRKSSKSQEGINEKVADKIENFMEKPK